MNWQNKAKLSWTVISQYLIQSPRMNREYYSANVQQRPQIYSQRSLLMF
ncbi:MAG: hypothetical protein UD103_04105 [Bacteroidales bacterium]|nr:hypothetical protein [Bacteroidales bacterium]